MYRHPTSISEFGSAPFQRSTSGQTSPPDNFAVMSTFRSFAAVLALSSIVSTTARAEPNDDSRVWRSITAGAVHACAIRAKNDRVVCWGEDRSGAVKKTPRARFAMISASTQHTCGVTRDKRSLRCWGERRDIDQPSVVARTPKGGEWEAVYATEFYACGIRHPDGALHCWGHSRTGEFDPEVPLFSGQPMSAAWIGAHMVCGLHRETKEALCTVFRRPEGTFVEIGEACGLGADGTLTCWGADPIVEQAPTVPIRHLGTGNDFTPCALRASDGHPVCWSHTGRLDDTPAVALESLAVGWGFACGITRGGGSIVCWGERLQKVEALAPPD